MPDNKCKWKSKQINFPEYQCHEPPLSGDEKGWCILHSEREDKNIDEFTKKVEERLGGKEKIDLKGCYFPEKFPTNYFRGHIFDKPVDFSEDRFSQGASFGVATFLKEAYFNGATFSQTVDFDGATFSEAAYFRGATFSEGADFRGARFSQRAVFGGTRFSQWANFGGATFSQEADFFEVTFSQEAVFFMAKFKESAMFSEASFEKRATFGRAIFENDANFDSTAFKGRTDFEWAEFRGWTFFFRNSRLTYARPQGWLEPDKIQWPESVRNKIDYDESSNILSFEEIMSQDEKRELLELLQDDSYKKAIDELYESSQITTLGTESVFRYTRFEGETIRFQEADLSQCSFLHSNIDKVDFRYCEFGKGKGRQNVLKDERDADEDVGTALAAVRRRTGTSPVPTEMRAGASPAPTKKGERTTGKEAKKEKTEAKVRREKYEHVQRLYLELKKNFEEKRDWNTAGDFHYGEMECRRKIKEEWLWRNVLSLEALYFWLSGYGERPLRAAVSLGLLIGVCAIVYMFFEDLPFLKSGCDSIKITTLQRIGHVDEYASLPAKAVFMFESIMGPILIALLALALRRKVKR